MASSFSQPSHRYGHQAAAVQKKVYMFGGEYGIRNESPSRVHIFDQITETWTTKEAKGEIIPKTSHGACTSSDNFVYVYGGGSGNKPVNAFYKLDTTTLEWSKHDTVGPRSYAELIANNGSIFLFGGYDSSGRTNSLHCFKDNKWSSVAVTGTKPSPRNSFSFTMIDKHRAVLFGGSDESYLNDVYILDLNKMHWSVLEEKKGEPWPQGRCGHAAVCLGYGGNNPQLLVSGGNLCDASSTLWILDINTGSWQELNGFEFKKRGHNATAIYMSSEIIEVTLFGGVYVVTYDDTIVLQFEYQVDDAGNERWVLTDTADSKVLGSEKRVLAKKNILSFAPAYKLTTSISKARAGESVSLKFFIDPLPNQHFLKKEGSESVKAQYEILNSEIIFPQVEVEDSGTYTISCISNAGVKVSATFELDVIPAKADPTTDSTLENKKVKIDKELSDFGFKFGESTQGLVVNEVFDDSQCYGLSKGDIIWKVNGENVLEFSANQLSILLENKRSVSFEVFRPSQDTVCLERAIRQQDMENVTKYLKAIKDVSTCCFESSYGSLSALMIASEEGRLEVVKLLVEKQNAQVNQTNQEGWSALMIASLKGHSDVAKFLLEKGAQVDLQSSEGWSSLMFACKGGHVEVVQLLLGKGASVDLQDNKEWSALMVACEKGHVSIVQLLLGKGTKVTNEASLKIASQLGSLEIIEELLKQGADIDMQDKNGWSALMSACKENHFEVVKRLLQKKANVNLQNSSGFTALMIACEEGHSEIAMLLISHGSDIDQQSHKGDSALTLAMTYKHQSITDEIIKHITKKENEEVESSVDVVFDEESPFPSDAISLTLKSLNMIKWKDDKGRTHHFHLVTGVRRRWKKFGLLLNYSMKELENIKREHEGSDELCWCDIMEAWLLEGGTTSYPANWNGLHSLLVDAGALDTAKLLKIAVSHADLPPTFSSTTKDDTTSEQQSDKPAYDDDIQQLLYRNHRPDKPPKKGTQKYVMLQDFCGKVQILIQVVRDSEFKAAVTCMKPPENTSYKTSVTFPSAGTVIGMFAEKETALIHTDEGSKCSDYLEEAFSTFPKAKFLISTGVGYAFDSKKYKLGDVLVSKQICDFQNFRFNKENKLIDRGQRIDVTQDLVSVFCKELTHEENYPVSESGRFSCVDAGQLASLPFIVESKEIRDKIHSAAPEAIGGDMESRELLKFRLKRKVEGVAVIKGVVHYADGNKADDWEFTASLAALNYVCSKLYYYEDPNAISASTASSSSKLPKPVIAEVQKQRFMPTRHYSRFPPTFVPRGIYSRSSPRSLAVPDAVNSKRREVVEDMECEMLKVVEKLSNPVSITSACNPVLLIDKCLAELDKIVFANPQAVNKALQSLPFLLETLKTVIIQSTTIAYSTSKPEIQEALFDDCKVVSEQCLKFFTAMKQINIHHETIVASTGNLKSGLQTLQKKLNILITQMQSFQSIDFASMSKQEIGSELAATPRTRSQSQAGPPTAPKPAKTSGPPTLPKPSSQTKARVAK